MTAHHRPIKRLLTTATQSFAHLAITFAFAALMAFAPTGAWAGPTDIGAFTAPSVSTTQFNTFGSNALTGISSPASLGIATYSSVNGLAVWSSGQGQYYDDCGGGCVTSAPSTAELDITLSSSDPAIGLYVGQATSYNLSISFYSPSGILLGTQTAQNSNETGGLTFVGWQDPTGVESVHIVPLVNDSFLVAAASIYVSTALTPVPEPGSLLLLGTGLIGLGLVMRKRRKSA